MNTAVATRLRDYQQDAVEQLREAIVVHGSAVYVLPTGAGKTVVAAEIARLGFEKGSRTLLLVHRRELVKQGLDTLRVASPGLEVGVEAAGWPSWPHAPLQVGMVQSIVRRSWDVRPDIVIVDEAHHARAATWDNVLARWPDAVRIGLTATPERLDRKGLGEHFATMVLGPTIPELVEQGWLAPCRVFSVPDGLDEEGVKRDIHGDLLKRELGKRITKGVVAKAANAYCRYTPGKKAIFFGINRAHSRMVCAALREMGVAAEHVEGDDHPARRDRIMQDFRHGKLSVVGNVDIISEGFDAPSCEVIMLGARTSSIARYLQWCGRAMRPGPGKVAVILCLAGTAHTLGLPDEVREWSLEDGEIQQRERETDDLKVCPECRAVHRGMVCRFCGYERQTEKVEEVDVELKELTSKVKLKEQARRREELHEALRTARASHNPRRSLEKIRVERDYRPGFVRFWLNRWGLE